MVIRAEKSQVKCSSMARSRDLISRSSSTWKEDLMSTEIKAKKEPLP